MIADYPEPLFLDDIDEIPCPHCGVKRERADWEALFKDMAASVICPNCGKKVARDDIENC